MYRLISWLRLLACLIVCSTFSLNGVAQDSTSVPPPAGHPVTIDEDTLFYYHVNLGPLSPSQRAQILSTKLDELVKMGAPPVESVRIAEAGVTTNVVLDSLVLVSVTDDDAAAAGQDRISYAEHIAQKIRAGVSTNRERYSLRSILISAGIVVLLVGAALFLFWLMTKFFPRVYEMIDSLEGKVFRAVSFKSHEFIKAETVTGIVLLIAKGIRLAISLGILYFIITYSLGLFPYTQAWNVKPILGGLLSTVLVTVIAYVLFRAVTSSFQRLGEKSRSWKGTLIKPVRIKSIEVLSEDRIVELLEFSARIGQFAVLAAIAYFYITLLFSFFTFTRTWAATLFGYVITPLINTLQAFVSYLPNLFYIIVIIAMTHYLIRFVKLIFTEISRGAIPLPSFPAEWAEPTYKITRFLIFAFAAIVIFPYLPGSDSPFFQGISVFIGILFSLGSTSAISNIVAGTVLTYMRAFRLGDRVKIADTVGDVIEKTLLVTRIRTVKNVDVTIPNAMVLGSHIINFSSSAKEKGLILHTTITIGYDVPWKQVHELMIAAAFTTDHILKEPKPFVLQTSLDDFYVSYELNAYTDTPAAMSRIYSQIHQNLQDQFNAAGVEIMSPHYGAMRDGNQVTIPADYLPKDYTPPSFRIWPLGNLPGMTGPKN